jgi:hypothetical protein
MNLLSRQADDHQERLFQMGPSLPEVINKFNIGSKPISNITFTKQRIFGMICLKTTQEKKYLQICFCPFSSSQKFFKDFRKYALIFETST